MRARTYAHMCTRTITINAGLINAPMHGLRHKCTYSRMHARTSASLVAFPRRTLCLCILWGTGTLPNMALCRRDISADAQGMMLQGAITSVEDHGYVLNLGLQNTRGFLRRKHAEAYVAQLPEGNQGLTIGMVVTGVALKATGSGRAVPVSIDPAKVAATSIAGCASTGLSSMTPGTLVDCTVTAPVGTGLTVELLGLTGTVDVAHLYV